MSDLSVFYRMLGIAEHIIDPSYYHILGIERKGCNAQVVRDALLERKRELRENIPGPQFVPMVLKFETEQLDVAAAVLADDEKRKAYDKQLMIKQKKIQRKSRQIEAVRALIAEVVFDDGTIDGQGRLILAEKLRRLKVQEHNITAILGRIPMREVAVDTELGSYSEFFVGAIALAVSEGDVDREDRGKLLELARRLGIDEKMAAETLEKVAGPLMVRKEKTVSPTSYGVELEKNVLDDTAASIGAKVEGEPIPMRELIDESEQKSAAKSEKEPEEELVFQKQDDEGFEWGPVFNFAVPFAAVIILTAVIILIGGKKDNADEEKLYEPVEVEQPVEKKLPVDVRHKPTGRADDQVPAGADDKQTDQKSASFDRAKQIKVVAGEDIKRLTEKFGRRYDDTEVFADAAFTMVLCCERATRLVSGGSGWEFAIDRMLGDDLFGPMEGWVVDDFLDAGDGEVDHLRLTRLAGDLRSSDKLVRYRAIDKLAADGSSEALEVLLGKEEGDMGVRKLTVSRRLRALRETRDIEVARAIAFRIATEPKAVTAHQMFLSLMDMTGIEPTGSGILKARNDEAGRNTCSNWWIDTLSNRAVETKREVVNETLSEKVLFATDCGKMLAVGTHYLVLAAEEIAVLLQDDEDWQNEAIKFGGTVEPRRNAEGRFEAAAAKFVEAVAMAVRSRRDLGWSMIAVETAEIERRARLIACDRGLQRAAVNIESAGRMLAVLAGVMDEAGEFGEAIEGVQAERMVSARTFENVLDELRYHGLYNVRLMDVVIEIAKRGDER